MLGRERPIRWISRKNSRRARDLYTKNSLVLTEYAMTTRALFAFFSLIALTTGCGLYEDIPGFSQLTPTCDAPCGACDLGRYSCAKETCLNGLAGLNDEVVCG